MYYNSVRACHIFLPKRSTYLTILMCRWFVRINVYLQDKSHNVTQSVTRVPWIPRVQHQPWHLHGHRLVKRFGIGHFPHAFAEERYGRPANRRENSDHRHDDQQLTHTGQGRCVESKKKNYYIIINHGFTVARISFPEHGSIQI